jgi:YfiH family protein
MEKRDFAFWKLRETGSLIYLVFDGWHGVRVLYSTRVGGVSGPPFDTLNLHLGRGDESACVWENRGRFFEKVEIDPRLVIYTTQTHSSTINRIESPADSPQGDGMVTNQEGLYLGIFTADCQGIFLHAPEARVVGAIHAGREGLAGSIIGNGIRVMCEEYHLKPDSIEALLGPSIGPCCYEVGGELSGSFAGRYFEDRQGRIFLDLWRVAEDQLAGAGVQKVYSPHICNMDHPDLFFSYRRSGQRVGENLGLIGLAKA